MPTATSQTVASLLNALLLEPADGQQEWEKWRAEADLDSLDKDSVATIPLLFGRLSAWLAHDAKANGDREEDSDRNKLFGICKRAWALNQLRYRELACMWTLLWENGVAPIAIGGCAAWALLYWEEKAVHPISSTDIHIPRERATIAMQVLRRAGWTPELEMSVADEVITNLLDRLWFRSPRRTFLSLQWQPKNYSAEASNGDEPVPPRKEFDLLGIPAAVLPTEELLLDALTRPSDELSWKCDAVVLGRNRTVDWKRFRDLSVNVPSAEKRLTQIQEEFGVLTGI